MATTAYHNQFIRDLDKKCTILFCMVVQVIAVHILLCSLMDMFKSNDNLQIAYICAPARLHAMPIAIVH